MFRHVELIRLVPGLNVVDYVTDIGADKSLNSSCKSVPSAVRTLRNRSDKSGLVLGTEDRLDYWIARELTRRLLFGDACGLSIDVCVCLQPKGAVAWCHNRLGFFVCINPVLIP